MYDICYVDTNCFGRWVLINAREPNLAWSGSQWVPPTEGIPAGDVQISDLTTQLEAIQYGIKTGFLMFGKTAARRILS